MPTRLEHANMAVRDIDAMARFIQTAFPDFEVRGQGKDFEGIRRWMHIGNDETYIALVEAPQEPETRRAPYEMTPGFNHLGYEVSDAAALRQRMLAGGYRDSTVPNEHPHRTRVYFYDPEGNDWEFVEYHTEDRILRNDYSDAS